MERLDGSGQQVVLREEVEPQAEQTHIYSEKHEGYNDGKMQYPNQRN